MHCSFLCVFLARALLFNDILPRHSWFQPGPQTQYLFHFPFQHCVLFLHYQKLEAVVVIGQLQIAIRRILKTFVIVR
jgi:hypothetical protein